MRTTCEYNPVQSTFRNSPELAGKAPVILGKYTISCLGGPPDILLDANRLLSGINRDGFREEEDDDVRALANEDRSVIRIVEDRGRRRMSS